MDHIKEAFNKVKNDYDLLKKEINFLKEDISTTSSKIEVIYSILKEISEELTSKNDFLTQKELDFSSKIPIPTHNPTSPTQNNSFKTQNPTIPTHNLSFKPLEVQNIPLSTGNEGVPTDRQTHQQTHQQIDKGSHNQDNSIENASKILDSLDNIKKELRLKFKRLTEQELLVFSTIYQFEEEKGFSDYKILSEKLNLTESSIRDYVGRLVKKGIPIDKKKINNKAVQLTISPNLKKIASLSTILMLKDL